MVDEQPPLRPLLPPVRKTSSYLVEYAGTALIPIFFVGLVVSIRYTFSGPDWECSGDGCLAEFDRLRGWTFPIPLFLMLFVCAFGFAGAILLRIWGRSGRPPTFEPQTPTARPALTGVGRTLMWVALLEIGLAVAFALAGLWLVAGILGSVGITLALSARGVSSKAARSDRILATGTPAVAEITAVERAGAALNGSPLLRMSLTIYEDDTPVFPLVHKEYVPTHFLGRVQVGARLPVRVDPLDSNNIAIEWNRAVPADGSSLGTEVPEPSG